MVLFANTAIFAYEFCGTNYNYFINVIYTYFLKKYILFDVLYISPSF